MTTCSMSRRRPAAAGAASAASRPWAHSRPYRAAAPPRPAWRSSRRVVSAPIAAQYPSGAAGLRKLGRRAVRRAGAAPRLPVGERRVGPGEADVHQADRELRVLAERVLEGGVDAGIAVPREQLAVECAALPAQRAR